MRRNKLNQRGNTRQPNCKHSKYTWQKEEIKGRNYIRKWKKCDDPLCNHTWGHKRVYKRSLGRDGK